jgi:phosphoribosylanthranilate isomerase
MAAKVKVCGLMRPDDASRAAEAGASYLGVVFAGGPRTVTQQQAREVVAAGSGVPVLGVFADQPLEAILQIRDRAGLRGVQLHGSSTRPEAERLRAEGLLVWRVVRIAAAGDLSALVDAAAASDAVLVEPLVPRTLGGAGIPLDLAVAREARARLGDHPMVLAGGLTPETVARALAVVRPEIVDVSSGVECEPGIKDHTKILRFVEAVVAYSPIT